MKNVPAGCVVAVGSKTTRSPCGSTTGVDAGGAGGVAGYAVSVDAAAVEGGGAYAGGGA
jgi:hypothetical protein